MDIAIIIGGNVGIGLAISRKLIILGFRVYAIANDFSKTPFAHKDFLPISISLNDPEKLKSAIENIINKEDNIYTIINAPEKTVYPPFDSTPLLEIQSKLTQCLLIPILLTRLAINKIRQFQGFIINITHETPASPLNCAAEGGLSAFYTSLFQDYRNHGVNITDILVQSTTTDPINCEMVANTIDHLIRFKGGNAVTKISIRSQDAQAIAKFPQITPSIDEFKEIQLPPKSNFPPEQEPILTQEPKRIPQKRISQKVPRTPKISRETVVIQREKKTQTPKPIPVIKKAEKPEPILPPEPKPKRTIKRPVQPKTRVPAIVSSTPKISRDSVIIPREKKSRMPKPIKVHETTLPPETKLVAPAPVRIRRGRPPIKKDI